MTKQWENGDNLTIDIQNNQLIISSDPNEGLTRQMEIDIKTNTESPVIAKLVIIQEGSAQALETADGKILQTADLKIFTVPKV